MREADLDMGTEMRGKHAAIQHVHRAFNNRHINGFVLGVVLDDVDLAANW